jgi:Fe-S oxidoreductase
MTKKGEENKKALDTSELMTILVSQYINQCISCHHCMDVCPVTKGTFTIDELNRASTQGTTVSDTISQFAFNCTQCGKCVPVCPMNIRRDYMVRYIKYKLRNQKPKSYTRYLRIKGPNKSSVTKILQKLFIASKKIAAPDLSEFMETTPTSPSDVLFYPGCYIYSEKTVQQTLKLLDHIGCSYTVLGGVTTCCGAPHLLQGEFDQADRCQELLHQKIKTVEPKIVITGCAECFEAIEHIKTDYNEKFEVLSIVQYLSRNIKKFPDKKIKGKIMIHDSCRFNKDSAHGSAARHAVSMFGELTEDAKESICCYQWNHGNDPENRQRQITYLTAVQNTAPTLACTCLTCFEELKKIHSSVEVIDIIQLFDEALNAAQSKEKKPL